MHFTTLGGLAALLGVSQAFLIPPSMANDKPVYVAVISPEVKAAARTSLMELRCPGCPVEGAAGVLHAAESILRFNVTIEQTNQQPDVLKINNLQVFPAETSSLATFLVADQFIKKPDGTLAYTSSPTLGYALSYKPIHFNKQRLSVLQFRLQILEVGSTVVRGVPSIDLRVLKTPRGDLLLATDKITDIINRPTAVYKENCSTLLCSWKAIIANKVNALKKGKGCDSKNGRPHGIPRPHGTGVKGAHQRPEGHGRPFSHRRPRHGAIARLLRGITLHIIVPILIGIALGVTASLVGMVVGHLVVFLWRLFFRRGERAQYCRVKQEEAVEEADDESKGFLENQGPPPVYEEAAVDEKTEEK